MNANRHNNLVPKPSRKMKTKFIPTGLFSRFD